MSLVDKYLKEETVSEASKTYKSFADRIKRAKSAKDISKVLKDIKTAVGTKDIDQKEAMKLTDMADDKLEDV